jgi:signal peptidase II
MSATPISIWRWYGVALLAVLLDQGTKGVIASTFELAERVPVSTFFNLVYVLNPGAAFSFLAEAGGWQRYFFIALALLVSAWLVFMLRIQRPRYEALGLSLVLGGAVGNVVDRIATGAVVDYLDFHWNEVHWPAFNLADVFVNAGVLLLLLAIFRESSPKVVPERPGT